MLQRPWRARLMPKMRRKADLPRKTCPVCGRPFAWRKKWARDWDAVVYCSERCRRSKTVDRGRSAVEEGRR